MKVDKLPTPSFVIEQTKLDANIERMAARAQALGVVLRPHGKTPKSVELVRRLLKGGSGLCTSTLLEAERYFEAGIMDIFYATALTPAKAPRAARLVAAGAKLTCLIDDDDGLTGISEAAQAAGVRIALVIEVAADDYRCGVRLEGDDLVSLAEAIAEHAALDLVGVMSYGGASYQCTPDEARTLAEHHRSTLVDAADRLRAEGHRIDRVSFGSTPAVLHAEHMEGITEVRCGIFAFQDLFQAAIGACEVSDIAGSVLTEVIGRQAHNNRIVIDAGGLALSKDRSTGLTDKDAGYGLVCDGETGELIDDLIVQTTSQELGLVASPSGTRIDIDAFPVGRRLRVLPNHADMTAAAYDRYFILGKGGDVIETVQRFNGW
jgi:D-serine deaminase-like pyridoxal phosphate-dependent protein